MISLQHDNVLFSCLNIMESYTYIIIYSTCIYSAIVIECHVIKSIDIPSHSILKNSIRISIINGILLHLIEIIFIFHVQSPSPASSSSPSPIIKVAVPGRSSWFMTTVTITLQMNWNKGPCYRCCVQLGPVYKCL